MVQTVLPGETRRPLIDRATLYAVLAAASFGAVAPLAKLFVPSANVWLTAGILHFGSGLGLLLMMAARLLPRRRRAATSYAPLSRVELPAMLVSILVSGCIGPALLMVGLAQTRASTIALLLNLEGLATMAIAWLFVGERFERRLLVGAVFILAGTGLLTWRGDLGTGGAAIDWGAVPVIGACLAWGIGNNYTRQLIAADPVQVTAIKGIAAGGINIALSMAFGAVLPGVAIALGMGAVGFVAYGLSFIFFILALRDMGTARAGAYLSVGPFFGALLAVAAFDEPLTPNLLAGGGLMAVGVWLCRAPRPEGGAAGPPPNLIAAEAGGAANPVAAEAGGDGAGSD